MNENINLSEEAEKYFSAHALLLDTYIEGLPGGTGIVFDWDLIPKDIAKPIILAGGLNASNVKDAIKKITFSTNGFGADAEILIDSAKYFLDLTFRSLIALIKGNISIKEMAGPIMIAKMAGETASSGGMNALLGLMAILSVNFGLLNNQSKMNIMLASLYSGICTAYR